MTLGIVCKNRSRKQGYPAHLFLTGLMLGSKVGFDGLGIRRSNGTISEQIDFLGDGALSRNTTESIFVLRVDRARKQSRAPTVVCLQSHTRGRTVVRGGVGLLYDRIRQLTINIKTVDGPEIMVTFVADDSESS